MSHCLRVGLIESCFQQSIVQIELFQERRKLIEQFQGTYRGVTKQKEWHLLLEYLKSNPKPADVKSLPSPSEKLSETALRIGRIFVNECHRVGSTVGVIDCQTHRNDKVDVKCIIKDPNSDLQFAVVLLVLSGTYLLSNDSERLPEGLIVITSLNEFEGKNFLSASPNSQVGIMDYFDPTLVIEKSSGICDLHRKKEILYTALPPSLD